MQVLWVPAHVIQYVIRMYAQELLEPWTLTSREVEGWKRHIPVGQRSGKVALNVGVHDWFEVLEFAVLEEVDDMDLEINRNDNLKK